MLRATSETQPPPGGQFPTVARHNASDSSQNACARFEIVTGKVAHSRRRRPPKAWTAPRIRATLRGWQGCSPCRSHRLPRHATREAAQRRVVPCQICSATRSCLPRRRGHQCPSSGRTKHRARLRGRRCRPCSIRHATLIRLSHTRATRPVSLACPCRSNVPLGMPAIAGCPSWRG